MLNDDGGKTRTYLPLEGTQIDITINGNDHYCIEMLMGNRTYVLYDNIILKSPHACIKRLADLPDGSIEFPKAIFY
jgi:hypothetical protein